MLLAFGLPCRYPCRAFHALPSGCLLQHGRQMSMAVSMDMTYLPFHTFLLYCCFLNPVPELHQCFGLSLPSPVLNPHVGLSFSTHVSAPRSVSVFHPLSLHPSLFQSVFWEHWPQTLPLPCFLLFPLSEDI